MSIEKAIHKGNGPEYIHCLRRWYGENSYISSFIKEVLEKNTFSSKCWNAIKSCFIFQSDITNLRVQIIFYLLSSFSLLCMFYYDHTKDMFVVNLLYHVNDKILPQNVDPGTAYQSVGGCNFDVIGFYLIAMIEFLRMYFIWYKISKSPRF